MEFDLECDRARNISEFGDERLLDRTPTCELNSVDADPLHVDTSLIREPVERRPVRTILGHNLRPSIVG